jgi:hypothetical protein
MDIPYCERQRVQVVKLKDDEDSHRWMWKGVYVQENFQSKTTEPWHRSS